MSDDQGCRSGDLCHFVGVDLVTGYHFIGDTGDPSNFRRYGDYWFLKLVVRLVDIENTAITGIGERHHGDLDDLIVGRIKPRRFQVEKDREFGVAAVGFVVSRWCLKAA